MPESTHFLICGDERLKPLARLVPVFIFLLLVGAVLFYKERMLFIDAPHVLFRIINDGQLRIEENRYGSFVTQMFPLLSAKLHLPFRLLVILYSASFYLFYLTVTLLLVYKFRNYGLAILFGLYLTLLVSDTYYWPNNEVHQGMGWLMLAFATSFYMAERKKLVLTAISFFLLFALAIWTHPLVMMAAIFLWFFLWLSGALLPFTKWQTIVFTVVLLVLSFLKYYQGSLHGYDNSKIEVVKHFDLHNIKSVFVSPMLWYFLKSCIRDYCVFTLGFIAGVIALMRERKYVLTAFTLLYATGYLLLVCIVFNDISVNKFYIESEYMPLTIICSAPFVFFLLPKLNSKIALGIVVLIFVVRLVCIYNAATPFTIRVALLNAINDKMRERNVTKVIFPEQVRDVSTGLIMNWGAPVESIVLSKLNGEMPQRTFVFLDPNLLAVVKNMGNDTMLGCWEKRPKSHINNYYFQIDTTSAYSVINYANLMK